LEDPPRRSFLIRKDETIAVDDRDFELLEKIYFHVGPEKLIEVIE
jgi:hypothetical protein